MQQNTCNVTLSAAMGTKAGQPQSQKHGELFLNDEQSWSSQVSHLCYEGSKNIHFHSYNELIFRTSLSTAEKLVCKHEAFQADTWKA